MCTMSGLPAGGARGGLSVDIWNGTRGLDVNSGLRVMAIPPSHPGFRACSLGPSGGGAMDTLLGPIAGADHRTVGGVEVDIVRAGNGRVKRMVYPPGFRWSTHMKPLVGTPLCLHAHVGFLARGRVQGEYGDGCRFDATAPQVIVIE